MRKRWIFLLLCLLLIPGFMSAQKRLTFREGKFVIAQFTDIHWEPRSSKCIKTAATIREVLKSERPDLAVLSGDVVTGDPAIDGWKAIVTLFNEAKVPFVVTMGNHDGEHMKKEDIYDFLLQSPYYVGTKGPKEIMGYGNCVVPVYGSNNGEKAEALVYCIDSNDYRSENTYGPYDWIHFDQIDWYRRQSTEFRMKNNGNPVPAVAFFHIPLLEYNELVGKKQKFGNEKDRGVGASLINSGMFASFIDMRDVMGVFTGHDHNNDYIGINKGIALAYGRVSGMDGYGSLERGARIIELQEGRFQFDSWIATPSKREPVYYYPSGLNSKEESRMKYRSPRQSSVGLNGVEYTYYEGKCKRVSQVTSCKKVKKGVMPNFSIKEAQAADHFAYEFRTFLQIPERGVYNFYTFSDDGSALYVDGKRVVNNDGGHSAQRADGKIALEKGFHELRLLYFEDYMGQELEVGYSGRKIPETPLPASQLFLPQ